MPNSGQRPGGSGGGVHAVLAQASDSSLGIEIAIPYDATWQLDAVQRATGERATVEIPGATAGAKIVITAPKALTKNNDQEYEEANDWELDLAHGTDPVDAVAAIAGVSASVDVYWTADDYFVVSRDAVGVAGNSFEITYTTVDLSVGTTGVQISTVGVELQILISEPDNPTVRNVVNALNNQDDFSATYVAGNEPGALVLMPEDLDVVLPDGITGGTIRREDFTGGADGVDGVDAVVGVTLEFDGLIEDESFWLINFHNRHTLDEIASEIRGSSIFAYDDTTATSNDYIFPDADVEVVGDGDSVVGGTALSAVGASISLDLAGGVNAVPAEVTVDAEDLTVTVSYDVSDVAADVRDLFEGPATAVLIAETADNAELEAPPFTRAFRGNGGSGGGGSGGATVTTDVTRLSYEEAMMDIPFTAANVAVDTGIAVPANTKTFWVNYGSTYDTDEGGIDLVWYAIPIEEWDRLESVDVGDAPSKASARFTRTWRDANIETIGGTTARQVWLGKGSNGNIFVWTDNDTWDIYPFRARFEINEDVTVLVSGGVGGGTGTTLIPETDEHIAYDEDDEHKIININGKLYEVIRDHQTGHGKSVSIEELTHVNFRGFISIVNDVLTPADGQFVYVYSESLGVTGGFERYTTAGVTGFYPYNPFASGNEWENAPTGFNYTGELNYRGYRQEESDLIRVASAAGQAFVLLDERQVVFVDEYTPPTADYDYYKTRAAVPAYFNNPTLVLIGAGQTNQIEAPSGDNRMVGDPNTDMLLRWGTTPHGTYFGASDNLITFFADVDVTGEDSTALTAGDVYFQLTQGIWNIKSLARRDESAEAHSDLVILKVNPTANDEVIAAGAGTRTTVADSIGTPEITATASIDSGPFEVGDDDVYYFVWRDVEAGTATSQVAFLEKMS